MKRIRAFGQYNSQQSGKRSKTMELTKEQRELYKGYVEAKLASYCKPTKVSCAASLTSAWRTGLTMDESIAHCKQYNERVYKGTKSWGQKMDDVLAHRKTMYQWFGFVIRKVGDKLTFDMNPPLELVFGFWFGTEK